jgi:hypothetical protein
VVTNKSKDGKIRKWESNTLETSIISIKIDITNKLTIGQVKIWDNRIVHKKPEMAQIAIIELWIYRKNYKKNSNNVRNLQKLQGKIYKKSIDQKWTKNNNNLININKKEPQK